MRLEGYENVSERYESVWNPMKAYAYVQKRMRAYACLDLRPLDHDDSKIDPLDHHILELEHEVKCYGLTTYDKANHTLREIFVDKYDGSSPDHGGMNDRWIKHDRGSIPLDVFALEASKDQMRLIDNHVFERFASWKLRQDEAGVDLDIKLGDVR